MNTLPRWGPQHQKPYNYARRRAINLATVAAFVLLLALPSWITIGVMMIAVVVQLLRFGRFVHRRLPKSKPAQSALANGSDPLQGVLEQTARLGGGVYLGTDEQGGWVCARREQAVLLLGPPRSGKSTAIITPALLAHSGPVVCASTKPDLLSATAQARSRLGRAWEFDPTGERSALGSAAALRWSPVTSARTWDGALLMARGMVTGSRVGAGTTDSTHWSKRATALLAPLLHAAAISLQDVGTVAGWVLRHDLHSPTMILERSRAVLPAGVLAGLENTEARERSSIFSAAADALDAYSSTGALAAAQDPNFDAGRFVRSSETTTFTRLPSTRRWPRPWCAACSQRSVPPPTTPIAMESCHDLCCSRSMRRRISPRSATSPRSPQKAAAKACSYLWRSRISPRRASAGDTPPTGSSLCLAAS